MTERNFRILDLLQAKAKELDTSMVRLAMAWTMTHPSVTAVISGPRTTEQIDDAIAAHEMGLNPELRAEMSAWARTVQAE